MNTPQHSAPGTRSTHIAPARTTLGPSGEAGSGADTLVAADGRHLAATWAEPAAQAARAVAVISAAAGVPRGYYRAFAQWLAHDRGYAVLSYDYRGIAGSRRGSLRNEPARMQDWALLDMSAALAAAQARRATRELPLLLIGHSFGGNAIGFANGVEKADAILTVASQVGEPRLYPGLNRWLAEFFFRAWLPTVVPLFGHLPAWALGPGAQALPAGVALQWAQWGRQRGWAFADPAMKPHSSAGGLTVPVHLWNISDDLTYAPPGAVDALAERFRNAAVQRHSITPQEVGQKALGHFGAFRRQTGPQLWQRLLEPIEQASPALHAAMAGAAAPSASFR